MSSRNDQWIGRARSTVLKALWVQLSTVDTLADGDEVQWTWDATLEIRPRWPQIKHPDLPKSEAATTAGADTGSGSGTANTTDMEVDDAMSSTEVDPSVQKIKDRIYSQLMMADISKQTVGELAQSSPHCPET